jgi:hypothetical protein
VIRSLFQILLELSYKKAGCWRKIIFKRLGAGTVRVTSSLDRISVGFRTVLTAWVEDDMSSG